jgi:hypothetical protein
VTSIINSTGTPVTGVPFIVSQIPAALTHRKPASAGTSPDSCRAQRLMKEAHCICLHLALNYAVLRLLALNSVNMMASLTMTAIRVGLVLSQNLCSLCCTDHVRVKMHYQHVSCFYGTLISATKKIIVVMT